MHRRLVLAAATALAGALVLTSCASAGGAGSAAKGPVELVFWTWTPNMDKVAELWNEAHPDVHVTVEKQVSGGIMVPKLVSAVDIGIAPDLVQVEYQVLPTLVAKDVLVDIAPQVGGVKDRFAPGIWQQVTVGSAAYAVPQDTAPLALYYRHDLFKQYGLKVPATWDEFADTARELRRRAPGRALTTFSANDPGLFAGLAQQAGATWWRSAGGGKWKVAVDDEATRRVAGFWGGLVREGAIDNQPMYTEAWSRALTEGSQLAWVSAVWAPGALTANAPATKGKWAIAPLPQWKAGESVTGSWGGSGTGVTVGARKDGHVEAAARFAAWLNTDPVAVAALVREGGVYPAATAAQTGDALAAAPEFFANQPDFYARAAEIARNTAPSSWGPDVDVAYAAFKDAFGRAAQSRSDFAAALAAVQRSTRSALATDGLGTAG
ncbi:ABC transporter substrate-binding protein [Kitasatospora terrestris]|uniref:Extracellular solute-binding protein n=1 Tax=Kitasatospora terrestris TaxID=258051 RepID=A0ABP9DED6_9ACTN